MIDDLSPVERLVREKDTLNREIRDMEHWLRLMRLGEKVSMGVAPRPKGLRSLFFAPRSSHDKVETVSNLISGEFYDFIAERLVQKEKRRHDIEMVLAAVGLDGSEL